MDTSIFMDKAHLPEENELKQKLGKTYELWQEIIKEVNRQYPLAKEDWNYPGKKYGWSFRVKDKKRAIFYLLPRDQFFKVAFVYGQKATDEVLGSNVSTQIKTDLEQARAYAEGRGIRIEVKDHEMLPDIFRLIEIKLKN